MVTMSRLLGRWTAAAAAALALGMGAAHAEWPDHPVRVVVPYPPGGSSDQVARPFADVLSKALGQPFVLENRGGAAGSVGAELVAKAPADGYTLLFTPMGPLTIVPHLRKAPYDPMKDFQAIGRTGNTLTIMAVHPSLGVKNVQELIAVLKKSPGKYSYGSAGLGSLQHLTWEVFKKQAGVDIVHVPYRGSAEALNDLLTGQVQMMSEMVVIPHVRANKLVMIASTGEKRHPEFPDVPAVREQGLPDFEVPSWFAAFAPAGTPRPIIDKINATMVAAAKDPEFAAKMLKVGFGMGYDTPDEMQATLKRHYELFGKYIADAGVKIE